MPFGAIKVRPGVNTVATPTLNEAGISASNLIRFRGGVPEKMGGWTRYVANSMGSITKDLHAWEDLDGNSWLAAGNLESLQVINAGVLVDVIPQELVSDTTPDFSTTAGSYTVSIVDPNITNISQFSAVYFNTPIAIGGICLSGLYAINGAGTGSNYSILAAQPAITTALSGGVTPQFATTNNSPTVLVTFTNHGLEEDELINFPIATIVGGVTISGSYPVTNVLTNSFEINVSQQATSTTTAFMNGGNVQFQYLLAAGPSYTRNFGALGPLGEFAIGEGYQRSTTVTSQTGDPITATDWTLDNWGETLLACPKGGPVFYWQPNSGFDTASPIGTGPPQNNGIFVSMPQQILVCYGSARTLLPGNLDSTLDRLRMRWSTAQDFTEFKVGFSTLAGSFHIGTGSRVVGGIQAANFAFILTDIDIYAMTFVDYPIVFNFNQIGTNCGLVGPHAIVSMRGATYWMSNGNFHTVRSGTSVQSIPCPIWDNIFQNFDKTNGDNVCAAANSDFDEIIFFYPSLSSATGQNDKYAKLNVVTGDWDYGDLSRSAWTDRSVLGSAIAADPTTFYLQQHETGYSDDGAAMNSYFETGYFAVGDGEDFAIIDHMEPDMKWTTSASTSTTSVDITITATDYPSGGYEMTNAITMTSTTQYITPRLRGRQAKFKVQSNDANGWWRLGNIRYRYGISGRR